MESETKNIFENGATWLRADFHLHTKADPLGLKYTDEDSRFFDAYLELLEKAEIKVGVIANYNRLYVDEFRELYKKALKRNIYLIPGMELCINEGGNDVHVIVCFNYDEWINNKLRINKINQLESSAFENKSWSANQCSNFNLIDLIKKLNGYHADFFIIPAHVDAEKGLFYETEKGKRIRNFWETDDFKLIQERVLAFQKVRKRETEEEILNLFSNSGFKPAFVEGCDPKLLEDIGRGEKTYIKLGSYDFNSIKYILKHEKVRIASKIPKYNYSYIKSIRVEGNEKSRLENLNLHLSPELNSIIGGKGAGKSSVLETIRFCLDLRSMVDEQDKDKKLELVLKGLADGGKVILEIVTQTGNYTVEREFNGPAVIKQENRELNIPVSELFGGNEPIYFGQKDLSEGEKRRFNDLFLEKLVPSHLLKDIREQIKQKTWQITQTIQDKRKLETSIERLPEVVQEIEKYTHRINLFEQEGILEKLNKEIEFSRDEDKITEAIQFSRDFLKDIDEIIEKYDFYFENLKVYKSKVASEAFQQFLNAYEEIFTRFEKLKAISSTKRDHDFETVLSITQKQKEFSGLVKSFRDEFAQTKRSITDSSINPSDYAKYVRILNLKKQEKEVLEGYRTKMKKFEKQLNEQLIDLA
ncbi:MAG: AAA family ATPase [Bacteroidales bacterium]|nr:AAA family ATPase [Bacteroidales bacterium]